MKKKNTFFILLVVLLPVVFFFKILLADTGKPSSKPISPKSVIQNLSPASIGDEHLRKAEVVQRTKKLQMPFIANEGQTDERVMFYANTFGGTVFVTKNGEIVYSLPQRKNAGADAQAHNRQVNPHKSPINKGEKGNAGRFDGMHHHSLANSPSVMAGGQNDMKQDDGKQGHYGDKLGKGARGVVLKEEIVGGWIGAKIKGEKKAITTVNDFRGNDQSKWKTNIQTYEVVTLGEVYDGIELKLKAYGNNVEKLFYVKPGADPGAIRLKLSGAKTLKVNEDGLLEAETALGTVKFTKPTVYQEPKVSSPTTKKSLSSAPLAGKGRGEGYLSDRQYIEAAYVVIGNEYSFKLEDYDRTQGLVIDPLLASTFLGGSGESGEDYSYAIAANASGSIYVAGYTLSGFPTTSGAWDNTYNGSGDAFVAKLSGDLTTLLASTILGGSGKDLAYSLIIDSDGNIYVTGNTESEDFPTTNGVWDTTYNGSGDAFVAKFSGDLKTLLASTLLGEFGKDSAYSLVIDSDGNIYVTGNTESEIFPTTNSAWDTSYNGGGDVFVSKFNGNLTNLLASTYLGGTSSDFGNSIAIDAGGNIYVAGRTQSSDFQTTDSSYDTSYNGAWDYYYKDNFGDGFVSKLDGDLTGLLASTYLGGTSGDLVNAMTIDSSGNVYVAGWTLSEDFPTTPGAYDTSHDYDFNTVPVYDAFVSKLNANLTELLASTYLGEYSHDYCYSIAIDKNGNIYAVGYYYSYDRYRVYNNVFVQKLDGTLTSLVASIYLGGSTDEMVSNYGYSLVIDPDGNVYVTGSTLSSDFPTTDGAFDTSYNGNVDAFVSRLNGDLTDIIASTYLGGSSDEQFGHTSIGIDQNGNIYVTGATLSVDFPITLGAYDNSHNGDRDVFVSRLTADLTSLLVSTYLGGSGSDFASAIAIDTVGNVYVAGYTYSSDFPTTPDAYDTVYNGQSDGFISRLNGDLTNLLASTYLGGSSGSDVISSIIIDSDGNIYATGFTWAPDFPTTLGVYDTSYDADSAFVSKLNGDLTNLLASTFLGKGAVGNAIAIGSGGNIYVAGYTYSSDFPTTPDAYDALYNGMTDGFISRLNGDLTNLLASTCLGGASSDFVNSITIDSSENLYVTGWTNSSDFPTTDGAYDISYGRYEDAFISRLNGDLTSLLSSTYLGGSGSDYGTSIAIDFVGNVYVAGSAGSTDFATTLNAYDTSFNGTLDAFVSKFNGDLTDLLASTYLGGSGQENAYSIVINKDGNIYISGVTGNEYGRSSDFQVTTDAYDISNYGYFDVFVSKFDSNLSANPVTVPYVSTNLTVDGNLDESAWDIATDVSKVVIGTTNNTAKFGVLWDNTYLYVGMKVLDDTLYNDSTSVYENDSVEIYIDGDHNHGTAYDSYDRQFIKGWNDETLFEKNGKKTDVLHAWATITGGYSIELAIPWSNLGITPTAGMTIGFSVGYNDNDDGSGRQGQAVWIGTANNYLDTSALGDIVLGEAPAPSPEIINDLVTFKPIRSTYLTTSDTTGCGDGFVGQFSFDATLTNKSNSPPLTDLVVEVVELTNNNVLQNAEGVPVGVGARLTVPNIGDYADGVLSPGESVDVTFIICLTESKSFGFVADVLGIKEGQTDSSQVAALQSTVIKPGLAKFGKGSGVTRKGFFRRFHP